MKRKRIIIAGTITSYLILVACGLYFNIIPYTVETKAQNEADEAAKKMVELVIEPTALPVLIQEPIAREFSILEKYKTILEKTPDVVGKVKIEDTDIDYLVVQTDDNDYYISRGYEGKESKSGSIFMDYRSESNKLKEDLSGNIVIYGHNMKSGTMFHNLRYYKKEKYLNEHNIIEFDTLGEDLKWEVFSVYVDSGNCIGNDTVFNDENAFYALLEELKDKSLIDTKINTDDTNCILSLVTCDYSIDDGRLFVHAKLIEE